MVNIGAARTSWSLFPQPVCRPGKKQVLYRHAWSFKPQKPFYICLGLMKVSCSKGFGPGDVFPWRQTCLVGDWKIQFTGLFPLFNATDAALDCKNDLVSSQNAVSTKSLFIIRFCTAPCEPFYIERGLYSRTAMWERETEGKTACMWSAVSYKGILAPPPLPYPPLPPPPPDVITGAAGLRAISVPPPTLSPLRGLWTDFGSLAALAQRRGWPPFGRLWVW